ncbi:hypothetical protein [Nocardia sp. NPDC060249]
MRARREQGWNMPFIAIGGVPVCDQPILGQVIAFAEAVSEGVEGTADSAQ